MRVFQHFFNLQYHLAYEIQQSTLVIKFQQNSCAGGAPCRKSKESRKMLTRIRFELVRQKSYSSTKIRPNSELDQT